MRSTMVLLCSTTYVRRLLTRGWGIHRMLDGALAMFFCSSRKGRDGNYKFSRITIREDKINCIVSKYVP
jgi:hypothetical protein